MRQEFTDCSGDVITDFIFSVINSVDKDSGQSNLGTINVPCLTSNREEKLLLQKMFIFGLYEEVIELVSKAPLSKSNLTFVKSVLIDRDMHRCHSIYLIWKRCGIAEKFKSFGLTDLSFDISPCGDDYELIFEELESTDFNTEPSKFIDFYLKAFQINSLRVNDFFKKRYPIPFVIKNFPYFLIKIGEASDDYSLYKKYINELNDDISDLIFKKRFYNEKSSMFDSLTVAELHKLIRLIPLSEVVDFFRKNESRHKNLIIELFRSNFELLKARQTRTYSTSRNLTSDNTAICLSGQLRGAAECLPYWLEHSSRGFSTFISTWEQVGYPRGAEAGRLNRMLPEEVGSYFTGWSVEEFERIFPQTFEVLKPVGTSRGLVDSLLDNKEHNNLVIKYNKEATIEEEISRNRGMVNTIHKNQIKMFYNMFVLNQMLEEYELENNLRFENVIWARPDFCVKGLSLDNYYLDDFVYTSRISDEGRMLDYLMVFKRDSLRFLGECYMNLMSSPPSRVFGYNHGPRLITDMFLANGYSALEITQDKAKFIGLKGWSPNMDSFYSNFYIELMSSKLSTTEQLVKICKSRRAI